MAYLEIHVPGAQIKRTVIEKRLSSIGSSNDADIKVDDPKVIAIEAYISQAGDSYTLMIPQKGLNARLTSAPPKKIVLKDRESFLLGSTSFVFNYGEVKSEKNELDNPALLLAYQRILDFSERIEQEKDIEMLLHTLLREITQLTGAEHGFLVLNEDGSPRVRVQQSNDPSYVIDDIGPISDSIVKKVIEKREPLIINDALHDHEFSSSLSVINFRLTSVMCVPLSYQGHTFGAIYVGNNSFVNAFNQENLELMKIFSSQAALIVQNALHINALKKRTHHLQESLELTKFGGLIGGCRGMQQVFSQVEKLAQTDVSVLIVGETGTGKELIARELHQRSPRKDGPFIVINCGAIPENLLESELFGHVRGAFTGATQSRIGKFQAANQGTLFLDEIGEMPLHLQVKLLRALQDHRVTRVGDTKSENVDIRVISATNRDLVALVRDNLFREDLYYRLNVVQITLPPLKDRGNDVLVIANYFLQKYAKIYNKNIIGLDEEAQNAILNHQWPGNVRQLENRIRRAIVMCDHPRISAQDLDIKAEVSDRVIPLADALERFRARYITESLERNAGNRTKTASELGVDPRTIFRHLESVRKSTTDPNDMCS
jgi:transcriptional regulator with GAF, ATPase, and Fis domain